MEQGVPATGATNYTFRIEELRDTRIGDVVFEVHGTNNDTGYTWLVAECNTRAEAREVIRRRRGVK
jgi:hypothetical protein